MKFNILNYYLYSSVVSLVVVSIRNNLKKFVVGVTLIMWIRLYIQVLKIQMQWERHRNAEFSNDLINSEIAELLDISYTN